MYVHARIFEIQSAYELARRRLNEKIDQQRYNTDDNGSSRFRRFPAALSRTGGRRPRFLLETNRSLWNEFQNFKNVTSTRTNLTQSVHFGSPFRWFRSGSSGFADNPPANRRPISTAEVLAVYTTLAFGRKTHEIRSSGIFAWPARMLTTVFLSLFTFFRE